MKAQQEYESLTERIEAQKEKKLNLSLIHI